MLLPGLRRGEVLAPALAQAPEEQPVRLLSSRSSVPDAWSTVGALRPGGRCGCPAVAKECAMPVLRPAFTARPAGVRLILPRLIHAYGGQLGTTKRRVQRWRRIDESSCRSTKYPNILVDLVSGDELQDRPTVHPPRGLRRERSAC